MFHTGYSGADWVSYPVALVEGGWEIAGTTTATAQELAGPV